MDVERILEDGILKSLERDDKVIEHLSKIRFIGPFPDEIDVLLTSLQNALDEARLVDPKLSRTELLNILKNNHVMVFRDVMDYWKWKTQNRMPRNRP